MKQENGVVILSRVDMLKALYNSYLEKTLLSERHIAFYDWKQENLYNGESKMEIKNAKTSAERNYKNNDKMLSLIKEQLRALGWIIE